MRWSSPPSISPPARKACSATARERVHAGERMPGEGGGAVVLQRAERARCEGRRIYANVDGLRLVGGRSGVPPAGAEALARACRDALAGVGAGPADVGYMEMHDTDDTGLAALRSLPTGTAPTRAGRAADCIGHAGAASGMAALIKIALCLHERFLPAVPAGRDHTGGERPPELASRPWLVAVSGERRRSALVGAGQDGVVAAVLSEEPGPRPAVGAALCAQLPFLLPIAGEGLSGLLDGLRLLEADLRGGAPIPQLIARSHDAQRRQRHVLALVGHDRDGLLAEAARALDGLERAFATRAEWHTPSGSYCTPTPLAASGDVAFVYPGGTTSYPGLGRDLFRLFPSSLDRLERITPDVGRLLSADWLYGHQGTLSPSAQRALVAALAEDVDAAMAGGTAFSHLHTAQLREIFRVEPAAAFGYSRGEAAMLWALGVWGLDGETRPRRISPALAAGMAGTKAYARAYWAALPDSEGFIWETHSLYADAERVREALRREPLVHLSVVNGPGDVLVVGEGAACRRLIEALGCASSPVLSNYVMHSPPAAAAYAEMVRLHTYPVAAQPAIRFYSASADTPLVLESGALAERIAQTMICPVDFPRIVESAYADGARIFVEVGPTSFCTHQIDGILADRAHLAVAWDQPGMAPHAARIRALARLVSHGVPVDLSPLRPHTDGVDAQASIVLPVALGGRRIREAVAEGLAGRPDLVGKLRSGMDRCSIDACRIDVLEQHSAAALPAPVAPMPHPGMPSPSVAGGILGPHVAMLREHAGVVAAAHCALLVQRRMAQEMLQLLIATQLTATTHLPGGSDRDTRSGATSARQGAGTVRARLSGASPSGQVPPPTHRSLAGHRWVWRQSRLARSHASPPSPRPRRGRITPPRHTV